MNAIYRSMRTDHPKPYCWLCGRQQWQRPEWWGAPFFIERAHVVNSPRVEDRRAVILLCSLCHQISHGEHFADLKPLPPKIKVAHMLWLKHHFDKEFYDRAWLQRHSVRILPRLLIPRQYYRKQYRERHPHKKDDLK